MEELVRAKRSNHSASHARQWPWARDAVVVLLAIAVFAGVVIVRRLAAASRDRHHESDEIETTTRYRPDGLALLESDLPPLPHEFQDRIRPLGQEASRECGTYALKVTGAERIEFVASAALALK